MTEYQYLEMYLLRVESVTVINNLAVFISNKDEYFQFLKNSHCRDLRLSAKIQKMPTDFNRFGDKSFTVQGVRLFNNN